MKPSKVLFTFILLIFHFAFCVFMFIFFKTIKFGQFSKYFLEYPLPFEIPIAHTLNHFICLIGHERNFFNIFISVFHFGCFLSYVFILNDTLFCGIYVFDYVSHSFHFIYILFLKVIFESVYVSIFFFFVFLHVCI
jgi:hypothetical protein